MIIYLLLPLTALGAVGELSSYTNANCLAHCKLCQIFGQIIVSQTAHQGLESGFLSTNH